MLKPSFLPKALVAAAMLAAFGAQAQVIRVDESAFTAAAGLITFSEFASGTVNPTYAPATYGGGASAPTVTFGGFFSGQSLGTAATCPAGAALSGCVVGAPTGASLSLDPNSPSTFIATDGSNPTSPVLSGSPQFNGPITILFSSDQYGVGLDGGFFNNPHSTAITAFDRQGHVIGLVSNNNDGIEFLGLVTANGSAEIAGLQFSLVGDEPAGFAIDNLRFGVAGQVIVPGVPEPGTYALMFAGLGVIGLVARRRKSA
jgi:PEP-CTERM motif